MTPVRVLLLAGVPPARSLYDSARLAAGYAFARPAIHQQIVQRVRQLLGVDAPLARALDVGCGAGLSTAALDPMATVVVGVEPAWAMLAHRRAVAPRASFVSAAGERLPFPDGTFDLITAAGSINYMDRDLFLAEVGRVLAPRGALIIYDFSAGRRLRGEPALEKWFAMFERRYPAPAGYAFDVASPDYRRFGMQLQDCEEIEVAVSMTPASYVAYLLSEARVELAASGGIPEDEIRAWCESTLLDVFGHGLREVLFASYVARVVRRAEGGKTAGNC